MVSGPLPDPQANRTDLQVPKTLPIGPGQPNGQPPAIQVPTGLPYGEHQQLQQQAQAVPQQQPQPGAAPGGQPQPFSIASAMAAAKQMPKPSQHQLLTRPSERPNEPVTAGLPGSPAQPPAPRQVGNLSSMIQAVAHAANSPALSQLAARAANAGQ